MRTPLRPVKYKTSPRITIAPNKKYGQAGCLPPAGAVAIRYPKTAVNPAPATQPPTLDNSCLMVRDYARHS
jgi:hypothetical protein